MNSLLVKMQRVNELGNLKLLIFDQSLGMQLKG